MKHIVIITFITLITGCQGLPSLSANNLNELSNEDLCRALGAYDHNGELVLKIYDELKKRPEIIPPEKCRILETMERKQKKEELQFKNNKMDTDPSCSNIMIMKLLSGKYKPH